MKIRDILWVEALIDKIESKHGVSRDEVKYILERPGLIRFVERGVRRDEDVYSAMGKSPENRYLIVFFIFKPGGIALPLSARPMVARERRLYARQKKGKP